MAGFWTYLGCTRYPTKVSPGLQGPPLGSAVGGLVLAAGTDTGHLFPTDSAYTTVSLIGVAAMAVTAMTTIALARQRAPQRQSAQERTEPKST
jgi:hypothetical protein